MYTAKRGHNGGYDRRRRKKNVERGIVVDQIATTAVWSRLLRGIVAGTKSMFVLRADTGRRGVVVRLDKRSLRALEDKERVAEEKAIRASIRQVI